MKKAENKREWRRMVLAAVALIVFLFGMWAVRKGGLFLDEIDSYGLSNSSYQPFLAYVKDGRLIGSVFTRDELLEYVMVSENERFNYGSVYYNQTQDVHPPLFYFLLHTVCSLFPGSYTKWMGIGLNAVLFGLTLVALYATAVELFTDKKKALFTCVLYAFSREALSDMLLIRMYMLLTLFTTLLALLIAKSLHRPSVGKDLLIGVTIYLGMMTQYFYVVYAFLLCAAYDIYLLVHRQWKNIAMFSIPALAGVGGMLLSFPCWHKQLSSKSTVSLGTVAVNAANLFRYPVNMGLMIKESFLSFTFGTLILVCMICVAVVHKAAPEKFENRISLPTELKIVTFPALIAFLVIAVIAPYRFLRYDFHLQPVEALLFGYGFFELIRPVEKRQKKKLAYGILALSFLLAVCVEPEYEYAGEPKLNAKLEQYRDASCVFVTLDEDYPLTASLNQLVILEDVYVARQLSDDGMEAYLEQKNTDDLVLFVSRNCEKETNDVAIAEFCGKWGYTMVNDPETKEFSRIYILSKIGQ